MRDVGGVIEPTNSEQCQVRAEAKERGVTLRKKEEDG